MWRDPRTNQGIHYMESSYLDQDAEVIHQLIEDRQQQTFTFFSNNMNTSVYFDYMGVYVEGSIEVQDAKS